MSNPYWLVVNWNTKMIGLEDNWETNYPIEFHFGKVKFTDNYEDPSAYVRIAALIPWKW